MPKLVETGFTHHAYNCWFKLKDKMYILYLHKNPGYVKEVYEEQIPKEVLLKLESI